MEQMESYLIEENVKRGIKTYNIRGVYENLGFGKKWTDDKKKHHSNRMKALWSDPEWVSKRPKTFVRCPDEEPLKGVSKPKEHVKKSVENRRKREHQKRVLLLEQSGYPNIQNHYRAFEELGFGQDLARSKTARQVFMTAIGYQLIDEFWIAPVAQEV
jgi:hypothetical protein